MSNETPKKHLSYSGYSTFCQCPKKYDYHYNHKIRPESQPAHLLFGSATDKALNDILLGRTKDEAILAAQSELERLFTERIDLDAKDYDGDLISDTEGALLASLKDTGWKGTDYNGLATTLLNKLKYREELSAGQAKAIQWLVYYSFTEKIGLMIDGFTEYVKPRIKSITSVQKNVKRGILDFECEFHDIEGVVTCDNKTASRPYERDAVKVSVQLAGYGATTGAYIVFDKNVRKNRVKTCTVCGNDGSGKRHARCEASATVEHTYTRTVILENDEGVPHRTAQEVVTVKVGDPRCNGEWEEYISPEIIPQIIIDEVPEHNRTMVEEAYQNTEALIATGVFPRNLSACGKQYGKPCPYIDLCWKGSMKGLKREEK